VSAVATVVGDAEVMHRLALGVEVVDAVRGRLTDGRPRVGREVPVPGRVPRPWERAWPCRDLEPGGGGRFKLRHDGRLPTGARPVVLRVDDPTRRHVPRRFAVDLWDLAEVVAGEPPTAGVIAPPAPAAYVPVRSRLFRPWLLPGAAYALPRGTTGIRGRLVLGPGTPVRWGRVIAVDAGGTVLGTAHADDRGEFVLVLTDTGVVGAPPSEVDVELAVSGPDPAPAPDPDDPLADLPVEPIAKSANPPAPADLDSPLLRGEVDPAGYVASNAPRPTHHVPVGEVLSVNEVAVAYP